MDKTSPAIWKFLDHLSSVLYERNSRYGTENVSGPAQIMARIGDKVARLQRAVERGENGENDWTDLAGYAAIGWLLDRGLWDDRAALRSVYYAHPAGPEAEDDGPIFNDVHDMLIAKFAVYRPVGAFTGNLVGHENWMWETNLRNIALCDLLVAVLPIKSLGVAAEMLHARMLGKTVWTLAYGQMRNSSMVRYASHRIFHSLTQLRTAVEEVKRVAISEGKTEAAPAPV